MRVYTTHGKITRYSNETVTMENKRGEWIPAIPLPFYGLKKRCNCGRSFWKFKNYQEHYALEHIVLGEKPL